jgi:hypothetical protein
MFDEDSGDIAASEDDDGVVVFDDFFIGLLADKAGGYEVAKLTML